MTRRIGCIGECMAEMVRNEPGQYHMSFGGDVANTAVYLSRELKSADVEVDFISAVGDDPYSQQMLSFIAKEGVCVDSVSILQGQMPGLYFIETDEQGERSFYYYRSASAARNMFLAEQGQAKLETFLSYSWLYLSGISLSILDEMSVERMIYWLLEARKAGTKIVFDGNFRPRGWSDPKQAQAAFKRILQLTDVALVTFDDEVMLFQDEDPQATVTRLRSYGVKEGVVKLGADGCLVFSADHTQTVPVTERVEKPVDTTAAGDSFNAAYLAARIEGSDAMESAVNGNRLASQVIRHKGAIIDAALLA